jgi:MEDS: MEthanogen/methylotroph, DcmR Sensory domain/Helix-turn-helix domain
MSDMYNTKSAAEFLGVSEASIRRWSDSGVLPVSRQGRRGTRRYRESDLRTFARNAPSTVSAVADSRDPGGVVVAGPVRLRVHSHLPTFYDTAEGRMRLALPLLAAGLKSGEACLLLADSEMAGIYSTALAAAGADVDQALATGQLEIAEQCGTSTRAAVQTAEDFLWRAAERNSRVPRIVGEMTCERPSFPSDSDMLEYEVAINVVTRRFPCVVLCQYDVREFDGSVIMGALKAHPDLFSHRLADVLL